MAHTRGLPYGIFMKQVIFDMTEKGQLHQIITKWERLTKPDCEPLIRKGKPLSFEKLVSLFIVPIIGFLLAISILILEWVFKFPKTKIKNPIPIVKKEELILERMKLVLKEMGEFQNYDFTLSPKNGQKTMKY